jgi:hypothetical protein
VRFTLRRVGEARRAVDGVAGGGEARRHRACHHAGDAGDQDALAGERRSRHGVTVI